MAVLVVLAAIAAANYFIIRGLNEKAAVPVGPGPAVHPAERARAEVERAVADHDKRLRERERQLEQ